jgi:nucleoside-diphosphate-sugar epimerase
VKALVTGATGFLGRCLCEQLLALGHAVRGFCRRADAALQSRGVEIALGDIRHRESIVAACRGVDAVFHTAAVTGIWGPWRLFYETNTLGTEHVLEGCARAGVGKLVYTSSPSVVFDQTDLCGVDESVPYPRRWLCPYPRSKALAEQRVLAANGRQGMLTCALRPHLIWGPRDRQLIPRLIARARAGRLRRVGDGTNRIDIAYVENVAEAHRLAADALRPGSPTAGRAYFISQGEPVNCWQWINRVLALVGLPPIEKSISLRAAWRWGRLWETAWSVLPLPGEPPMTRFLAVQLAMSHYFDISRARRDFGYYPRVSTADGMQRMAADWGLSDARCTLGRS